MVSRAACGWRGDLWVDHRFPHTTYIIEKEERYGERGGGASCLHSAVCRWSERKRAVCVPCGVSAKLSIQDGGFYPQVFSVSRRYFCNTVNIGYIFFPVLRIMIPCTFFVSYFYVPVVRA